jgi:hypothetical protein
MRRDSMKHSIASPGNRIRKATWLALACLLAIVAARPATSAQRQLPAPPAQGQRLYLPGISQPFHVFLPLFPAPELGVSPGPGEQLAAGGAGLLPLGLPSGLVTRRGEDLQLDGRPYTFVGTNVSYLAGPYFPAAKMEEVVSFLAGTGVQVIRVWVEPGCDLDRVERLLDLGRKYDVRFILTLQDFFGEQDGYWFKAKYLTRDLPHIRRIVPRFADRPEVLMWELMNEPTCPAADSNRACWDALYRWAQVTSQAVKQLDPNHLVSVGTYRAGFEDRSIDTFRRVHALDTIDIVSVHAQGGKVSQGERKIERAMAHELGKPIYFGEVYIRGHDKRCQPLSGDVLQRRAQAIAADIPQSRAAGVDGYLLWQYAYGAVGTGSDIVYYCGVFDYFADDPVWGVIRAVGG